MVKSHVIHVEIGYLYVAIPRPSGEISNEYQELQNPEVGLDHPLLREGARYFEIYKKDKSIPIDPNKVYALECFCGRIGRLDYDPAP